MDRHAYRFTDSRKDITDDQWAKYHCENEGLANELSDEKTYGLETGRTVIMDRKMPITRRYIS